MATLLSSVSPVFASHLSSTGSTVQSVSAGVVSAKGGKAGSGHVGVVNGNRSCGVDQVVSRSSSRLGKKVSAKDKKLSKNRLSDGSGDYSFESSCGADASVNALTSASARSLIDVDVAASDWFLEKNNTINWSVNTTGARVADGEDTDAVNVAQLKALPARNGIREGSDLIFLKNGQISIGGKSPGDVINILNQDGDVRFILGVKGGSIKEKSTDAVNGAQLYMTNTKVVEYLGGGAAYDGSFGDKWTKPTFKVQEDEYNDVGSAFAGIGDKLSELSDQVEDMESAGLVQKDGFNVITIGKDAEGTEIKISNSSGDDRKLTGLAKGDVSDKSTDAINGSQLYDTNTKVVEYLGGDAAYEDGEWTKPTFKVQEDEYDDVGSAFSGVGDKLSELSEQVEEVENSKLVVQDPKTHKITIGAKVEGDEISITNSSGDNRKLTGLADGAVSKASTEAITGKQLYELNTTIAGYLGGDAAYEDGQWTKPTFKVQEDEYNDVGSAFAGIGDKLSELSDQVEDMESAGLVQKDGFNVITIGKDAEGTEIKISNSSGDDRKLTGLAKGDVSKESTEAITGKQLYDTNTKVVEYLGGDAAYEDGQWTKPTFKVQEDEYNDVGSAFAGIGDKLSELSDQVEDMESAGLVQKDGFNVITIGKDAEGTEIKISNSSGDDRKLTGLAKGDVSDKSTDAINGSQLYDTNTKVVEYLGGDAAYEDGEWTKPTFKVQEDEYDDVGSAFSGVGDKLSELSEQVEEVENSKLVVQDPKTHKITIGAKVEGDEISITNSSGDNRKLTGLADGAVSKASTEAITGKQLYELNTTIAGYLGGDAAYEDGQWTKPTFKVQEDEYNDVGSAFAGIGDKLSELSDQVEDMESAGLVQKDGFNVITIGKDAEGTEIKISNSSGDDRKLTGLADGAVSKASTEAITGKQLYELNTTIAGYLGGDAAYEDGEWKQPTFKIQEDEYNDVGSAFAGIGDKLSELSDQVEDMESAGLVQKDGFNVITIGKDAEGTEIKISNSSGDDRKLTGLAKGDVSDKSTDAINGSQLYDTNTKVVEYLGGDAAYEDGEWTKPTFKVQEDEYDDVGSAFSGVGDKLSELSEQVEEVENSKLVVQDPKTHKITIGAKVEGDEISITNSSGKQRKLTGLADGDISKASTEAITGKQLYELNTTIAGYLGGDAAYEDGEWKQPTFKIQEDEYNDVGSAFSGVGDKLSELSEQVEEVENSKLVVQDPETHKITIGAKVEGDEISITNSSGDNRKLTGLADGAVSKASTEAITGKQLYELNTTIAGYLGGDAAYEDGEWKQPTFKIQEDEYNDVGSAFAGIGDKLSELSDQVEDMESAGLVQKDGFNVITIGKDAEGTEIKITNSSGKQRKLTGLADGDISKASTEAITGKQLYELNTTIAGYLGGDAAYEDGEWTKPTFKVQEDEYDDVGSAFSGVGDKLSELSEQVEEVENSKLVVQDPKTHKITIGAKVEGDEISITNSSGKQRKLTGLADGDISKASTEAITGKQLYELNTTIAGYLGGDAAYEDGKWTQPTFKVQEDEYDDVGSAFSGVGDKLSELSEQVEEVENSKLVVQDPKTHKITIGAKVEGDEISITNSSGDNRKLTGLADGDISKASTEAITGKQLYELNTTIAGYLGGDAAYEDGEWTKPTFKVQEDEYDDVGSAFSGVGDKLSELSEQVEEVENSKLVVQDPKTHKITIGAKVEGDEISITNSSGKQRKLTGLAKGDVSDKSTDAINGSQLYDTNTTIAGYLGGDAAYEDGEWTKPTFKVQEDEYNDVGSAFSGVGDKLSELSEQVEEVENSKLVVQDPKTHKITIGAKVEGDEISITNSSGKQRKLTGLADGDISKASTEAITGKQLYELNTTIAGYLGGDAAYEDGKWTQPTFKVQEDEYDDVGSAFSGVGDKLSELSEQVEEVENSKLVVQDPKTHKITIGAKVEGDEISITNSSGDNRKLTGLADGDISKASTEAITGKQLYELNTTIAGYLGGDAAYEDGEWTKPTFKVQEDEYDDVGSAFSGVGDKLSELSEQVEEVENSKLVVQDPKTHKITIGAKVEGDEISITNSSGKQRKLTGLADGDISKASTEAITGKQLYELNTTIAGYLGGDAAYEDGKWTQPTFKVQEDEYDDVGSAFSGVGDKLSELSEQVEEVENSKLVVQDPKTHKITIGAKVEGDEISITNSSGKQRKLTGLADGDISKASTEAITGKQLYELNTTIAGYLGGDAAYEDGEWKQPTFKIQEDEYNDVGSAFSGVGDKLSELSEQVEEVENSKLVVQDPETHKITIGAKVEGDEISITNSSGDNRKLTGLADGDISKASTEAITGKQLYELNTTIAGYLGGDAAYEDGKWTQPTFKVQEDEYDDVGSAFSGVGDKLSELSEQVEEVESSKLVVQDPKTHKITIGAKVEGDEISITNSSGDNRKLTGLADGAVSKASTEAITGKQLYELNTTIAGYLGGDAAYEDGKWTQPTFKVQEDEYDDVGSAFSGVGDKLSELSEQVEEVENSKLVVQDPKTHKITIGAKVEGDEISITNSSGKQRKLTGLADGDISKASTEAITGKQLYELNTTIAEYLGGGAAYEDGKWTQPTFKVQEDEYDDVGSAFSGVGDKLSELSEQVEEVENSKLVVQDPKTHKITIGAKVEGDEISITNSSGKQRKLTGLADGDISKASTEAITGKQLYELNTTIAGYLGGDAAYEDGKWTQPTFKVQEDEYDDVGSAFSGVGDKLSELSEQVEEVESSKLVVQDPETHKITIGAKVEGDEISITNSSGDNRKLTGLADGDISKASTEAITGKQLYELNTTIAGYLGGDAAYEDGKWTQPTFKVQEDEYDDVGSAFSGVGDKLSELSEQVEEVESSKLVVQDPKTHKITIGAKVEGDEISITNSSGDNRKLTGLADGAVSKASTEAITGKQLYELNTTIAGYLGGDAAYEDGEWTKPTFKVQEDEYDDVGSAFSGVGDKLSELSEQVEEVENSKLVVQDPKTHKITIGAKVEGDEISITNSSGDNRKLTGLADGAVSKASTEAITGKQLYELNTTIAGYLGGDAAYEDGKWTQPTFKVQEDEYDDVGSAFSGVGDKLSELSEQVEEVESSKLVVQDPETHKITIGAKVEGDEISITNSSGKQRKLTGLADGDISKASTEAITGKQLYELNTTIAGYLGGDAAYEDGKWTQPTFKVQEDEYDDVGSAFSGVGDKLSELSEQVEEVENSKLVVQDPKTHKITIGAKVEGDEISITNSSGKQRKLTGLADGDISKASTEAITGKQLYELNTTIAEYLGGGAAYEDGKWTQPTFMITNFSVKDKSGPQQYHTVASAFEAVNDSMSGLNGRVEQVEHQASNSLLWNNDKNAYDASHNGQVGKITNVADGAIEKGSTDAVTGHQLWETNEKIDNLENKVDGIISEVGILTDGVVTYDKDEHGNKTNSITLVGTDDDTPVMIDNVANGKVEEGSKQAVNGGQLKEQMSLVLADANKYTDEKVKNVFDNAVAQANAYTDMKFEALNYKVEGVQKEARQAAAIGLAVANLHYIETPGMLSIALGSGVWRGQSALAFGTGYMSEDGKVRSNFSVTTSGGYWGVGAGLSLALK
ncbi:Coiled stalk of trimeric autotransporter adhesin [Bartonella sp. WD12.1]|nr:Coiled stalk of trimeric autotransporter adhesin [Bartonella sp. WD12.1]